MKFSLLLLLAAALLGAVYFLSRMEDAAITKDLKPDELMAYKSTKKTLWQRIRGKKAQEPTDEAKEEEE